MFKRSLASLIGMMATIGGPAWAPTSKPMPTRLRKRPTYRADREQPHGKPGDKLRRKAANGRLGLAVLR